ncbi:MAG: glycosyltransferase [Elusimicrobiales bacterium]|nr:glycosyltransferase [Elusimicrobiales bacterium]
MGLKLLINSLFRGGAEKQFAALARLLPHDALILLENEIAQPADPTAIKTLSGHTHSTSPLLKTASIHLYARRLAALTGPGDTVLSFMERANIVNILAAEKSGHRAVICERTSPSGEFSGLRGALMRPLIRRYYTRAALVVANSAGVGKDLAENFAVPPEKIRVIQNGCDVSGIAALASAPMPPGWGPVFERQVIAAGGRLTAAKGHWHLLRIFSELKKTRPGAALVLIGEGELRAYLLKLSAGLGLKTFSGPGAPPPDADVYFTGYRENPYLFIAKAGLFAFTSLWEGFPNALLEAMACGTAVASADCASGPREILSPGTGLAGAATTPDHAPYGLLMPVLSGARLRAGAPLEAEERIWTNKLAEMLEAPAALRSYASAGLKRAADFDLQKTAGLWLELLKPTT